MVEEEQGVVGGGVEVGSISADCPMSATVYAEGVARGVALHAVLEVFEVDAFEHELGDVGDCVVAVREEGVEVALEAAGVVLIVRVYVFRVGEVQRAEVELDGFEGAGVHAAAAGAGGHIYALGVQVGVTAAGDVFAVGTHAVFVAVEEG